MDRCLNDPEYFEQLKPLIKEVIVSKHFSKDFPSFDTNLVLDSEHEHFTRLHKFEETIEGNHVFRALKNEIHIVYAIDKEHRLIFLRAFKNFKDYGKFLGDKSNILHIIEQY